MPTNPDARRPFDGPHIGDPPTVPQSANVVELNRALARLQEENARLEACLREIADFDAEKETRKLSNLPCAWPEERRSIAFRMVGDMARAALADTGEGRTDGEWKDWRPIAESPRDGSVFIAGKFDWADGNPEVKVAVFDQRAECFRYWSGPYDTDLVGLEYFTHYQPLPTQRTAIKEDERG